MTAAFARASIPRALLILMLALAASCAAPGRPVVADRSPVFGRVPASYVVQAGDTLYSIAWRFGLDYRALARANGIAAPYTIFVGQRLELRRMPRSQVAAKAPAPARAPPRARPDPPAPAADRAPPAWRRPTDAPVQRGFGNGSKGIDYQLQPGHVVRTAAAGEVVYAGSGLGGYRHLVIVKHDPAYLSAYSLHRPILVREGQRIKAGAILADTSDGGRRDETLHFEIRRNGEPVDPGSKVGPAS